jgi:hypothetical protein
MTHRNLAAFVRWFRETPLVGLVPPDVVVARFTGPSIKPGESPANVIGTILHRDGAYQAELFTFVATRYGGSFAEHRHPDVDSVELYLSGEIEFNVVRRGHSVTYEGRRNAPLWINAEDFHGGWIGPAGAAFVSLQRWRTGTAASSIGHNWIGDPHGTATPP